MIHVWRDRQPGKHPPEEVTALIEIPSGSRNKYELDKDSGLLRLDRVLYGWEKSEKAMRVINDSIARYAEKFLLQGP